MNRKLREFKDNLIRFEVSIMGDVRSSENWVDYSKIFDPLYVCLAPLRIAVINYD